MKALELLREDHQEALNLIGVLEGADDETGGDPNFTETFNRLNEMLRLHSQIEEEVLYPVMEEFEETADLIKASYEDHHQLDQTLTRLSSKAPNQEEFQEILAELRGDLENHIEEEEETLFPQVEELLEANQLDEMGRRIQEMKRDRHVMAEAVMRR